jgi:C-terminal processing protease CtpA/Prc
VLDGSPAQLAGIQRGDWLSSVNGQRITTSNYQLLKNGGSIKVARTRIYSTELGYTWQPADTLNLAASITMEINPFLIDTLYQVEGQRIAYLMYNEFSTGPENKGTEETYNEQMKAIFANFKAQQPDALILDLRYNNGGYLQCAQALGSLIAPASALGKNFVNLQFNAKANPQRKAYPLLERYAEAHLDLGKVYILTTSHTASASEALINGLIPYMGKENVILIGERTEGKNVAMTAFRNETYGITLWPVVAYTSNAEDFSDYGDGFEPTHELKERNIVDWYPLGDNREYLLKNAISLITTGSIADNS